ncbi:peptidoglycan DD-metalloendopeptidase family protein [Crassaminicella thermophila]|uniref:Peptidoglycan DD-metalloendopeptidase family protein n=1 Tax=Crassaminicella thermophila TaxID=2599308 RepID=A0A5C0SC33_CRATE|nr:peptidoglycan DD-metalloendopeptidase family protein [Crassaminicella thermophila]QEK11487.1 peptidoglycan DD-metalloendopeptidase family protein [Crassaminicella thermophila]
MEKSYKRFNLVFMLIVALFVTQITFAQDVSSEKKKLNQVNNQIKNVKNKLNKNKKEQKNVSAKIKELDRKIDKAEREITQINNEIAITKKKIDTTKKELEKAERNIDEKNGILNARLRVMYKNGNVGYAEVLLDSESILDFLSNLDMIKKIFQQDMELLAYMKDKREEIDTKKKTLESHKSRMLAMIKNMEVKQKELEISRGEMNRIKQQLQKDSKQLEAQIDELNAYAEKIAEQIRRKQSSGKYTGGKLAWPAPGYKRITSPYGYRIHPILKRKKLHTGIDIAVPKGGKIVAAGDGKVIHANWLGGYGKVVMIDHGGGIVTLYAHNSKLLVKEGQRVKKGQAISRAGSTGMSTGPHLHFEVRKNGKYTDPIPWVK